MTARIRPIPVLLALGVALAAFVAPELPSTRAQDAAAESEGDDPLAALRREAESAQGEARGTLFARLGAALEASGRYPEAAAAWREAGAARGTPDALAAGAAGEGRALLAFAEEVLAAGEPGSAVRGAFEDARIALRRARELGSKDVAVRVGLARCLAADGRIDEQIAELRAAAAESPDDAAPRRALAFALYHAGRYADALAAFRPLAEASPDDLNVGLTMAACAKRSGDEDLAAATAESLVRRHPGDARTWKAVWDLYGPERRWGELVGRLSKLVEAAPENALGRHYLGFACASGQQWDDALAHLDAAHRLDPKNVSALLEAARIRIQRRNDLDGASAAVRAALAEDPTNRAAADLLSFVAQRRAEAGDHAGAAREAEALVAARPDDVVAWANLGVELRQCGRYREAEQAYLRAIEVSGGDAQAHNDLGLLLLATGRRDEARTRFLAGVEASPDASDCMENLAWMARDEGDVAQSREWLLRAYEVARRRGIDPARFRRALDELAFPLPPAPRGR